MKAADTLTGLAFVFVGLVAIHVSSGYPPEARLIPIVVASCIVVVAVLQLAARLFTALQPLANEDPRLAFADAPTDPRGWTRSGFAVLSVLALFALVAFLGIVIGLAVYVPLALWVHARQRLHVLLLAALLTFGLVYGVFVGLMELPLVGGVVRW